MDGPLDRSAEVYASALKAMSLEQRLRVSEDLRSLAWEIKARLVRAQHPAWTEAQIQQQVSEIFLHASSGAD
jgi:hypothetical protein